MDAGAPLHHRNKQAVRYINKVKVISFASAGAGYDPARSTKGFRIWRVPPLYSTLDRTKVMNVLHFGLDVPAGSRARVGVAWR